MALTRVLRSFRVRALMLLPPLLSMRCLRPATTANLVLRGEVCRYLQTKLIYVFNELEGQFLLLQRVVIVTIHMMP